MRQMKWTIAAALFVASLGTHGLSETLDPPVIAEDAPRSSITSSVGSTEILISLLAILLVWAAYDQNERANAE